MMSDQQALDCTYSDNGNYDGCGGTNTLFARIRKIKSA